MEKRKIGRATATRILTFAKPYKREITIFLLVIVVAAVIGVVTPVLAGRVVNTITAGGPGAGRLLTVGRAVGGAVRSGTSSA